jgi:hypothetical protein
MSASTAGNFCIWPRRCRAAGRIARPQAYPTQPNSPDRAQAVVVREGEQGGSATFAEGLASSYEAFLETRNRTEIDEEEANIIPVAGF